MVTRVLRWGNSQGLRLTKQVLDDAHIAVGDDVDVTVQNGMIIIVPTRRVRGRVRLDALVARIPADYRSEETDWGAPMGREAW